ncbi:MAG: transposase [Candidatus Scalindua sp.]|nr:transposase [Candidatus Scalindua sp.]
MKAIKNVRLEDHDYSNDGYYFVTIRTNYGKPYLIGHHDLVKDTIRDLKEYNGVNVDYYVVMRNHVHIILILENCKLQLGEIVRRFKAVTSKISGIKLWQPNYHEHIIRNKRALKKIREYIVNNPLAEQIEFDQFYTDDA